MSVEKVQGLAEANALLGGISVAARHAFADMAGKIGRDVLAAQKRDVAKDKGKLEAGLGLELQTEELRVRIGLLNMKRRDRRFYGIIVEKGRRGQTVVVTRGRGKSKAASAQRRRAKGLPTQKAYTMKVRAMAARPFVRVDRPELQAEQRLANFWAEVLARAEGQK